MKKKNRFPKLVTVAIVIIAVSALVAVGCVVASILVPTANQSLLTELFDTAMFLASTGAFGVIGMLNMHSRSDDE